MPQIFNQLVLIAGLYILLMVAVYIYKFFNTEGNIKDYYKKRLIINSISLPFILVLWFVVTFLTPSSRLTSTTHSSGILSTSSIGDRMGFSSVSSAPSLSLGSPYYGNNASVSDTREFMKKSFNATLRTRKVESTAKKVEVLINGMDGRIDSSNIAEKYASIGFVVPKSKLDDFEEQLRSYTNKKFYSQSVSSQNLLGEKKTIEQNQNQAISSVASLTASKNLVQSNYTKQSNSVKNQISSKTTTLKNTESSISALESSLLNISDTESRTIAETQISQLYQTVNSLNNDIGQLRANLSNIETTFKSETAKLNLSLNEQNQILSNLNKTEGEFVEKVETVQGYVYLRHISVWEIITLYSPINPIWIIVIVGVIARIYFMHKKE